MSIELKNIKGAEDKDKEVLLDGEYVGTVMRGWLRLGGEQWVYSGVYGSAIGASTLKDIKKLIERRANASGTV